MPLPHPLPENGSIFLDPRGGERAMRVSWHSEKGMVVLSLWRENLCSASFRLGLEEVAALIEVLQSGLGQAYAAGRPAAAGAAARHRSTG